MSIAGAEGLARSGSKECTEALDILALYWRSATTVINTIDRKSRREVRRDRPIARLPGRETRSVIRGRFCATADMITTRTRTLLVWSGAGQFMPSLHVFSQNTNVLCLIARRWFRYRPGIRRPRFVKL